MNTPNLSKTLLLGLLVLFVQVINPGCSAVRNINLYSTEQEVEFGNQLDKEVCEGV